MKKQFLILSLFIFSLGAMDFADVAALTTTNDPLATAIFGTDKVEQKKEGSKDKRKTRDVGSFATWKEECEKLPKFGTDNRIFTVLQKDDLYSQVNLFLKLSSQPKSLLVEEKNWLNGNRPPSNFFDPSKNIFQPYVQKLVIPSDSIVSFHGDLHGDVHSLNQYIEWLIKNGYLDNQWKIIDDKFYMIFLGDYTDRGWYGAEVIFTILKIKSTNPEKVFLVRGNHEDGFMNQKYGFEEELKSKFFRECKNESEFQEFKNRLYRMYNYLPVALYVGCPDAQGNINYLQCCHGGLEVGFDPKPLLSSNQKIAFQLLGELKRYDQLDHLQSFKDNLKGCFWKYGFELNNFTPINPRGSNDEKIPAVGFMWYDFIVSPWEILDFDKDRGWYCGKDLTKAILNLQSTDRHKVRGVFRAHQHSTTSTDPMMRRILNKDNMQPKEDAGIGKLWIDKGQKLKPGQLWDGIVCTFCVAPCTPYGQKDSNNFSYDAFGLLKMSPKFEDWHLEVIRQDILNKKDN